MGRLIPTSPAKPPVANISSSVVSGPAPLTVNLSANNTIGNGSILSFLWSFGDNTTSTSSNPSHTFTAVGSYLTKLLVTNQYQLTDTKTVQITVTAPPLPTVWSSNLGISILKTSNILAKVSITVMDSKGKPVPNESVTGTFSGSVIGKFSSKTDAKGNFIQTVSTTKRTGGSATYTLNSVNVAGHIYDPTKNIKSVITIAW
jgi:PKD repeat protein